MIFDETGIDGVLIVRLERRIDARGFFARTFCVDEFGRHGLNTSWAQCNLSHSVRRGTLRGIHYQALPEPETRLVRATRGSAFAVVVDLRAGLRSFGRHFSCMLTESGGTMLYVPQGCGLGYQTMTDGTELFYQMSSRYRPALARGVRWNDPALAISWPLPPVCMSARDARLPTLRELEPALA